MSQPDAKVDTKRLEALPPLPRDDDGPVFAAPWQAQAFALAVKLSEQGHFTWKEWASALADELGAAEKRGEPDDGSHYYNHWVAALERLVTEKGLTELPALEERTPGLKRTGIPPTGSRWCCGTKTDRRRTRDTSLPAVYSRSRYLVKVGGVDGPCEWHACRDL